MKNTKGKRRDTGYMFSRTFRKHRVVPLATYMRIYWKCDTVDIKEWARFKKECPMNVTMGKQEESTMSPSMPWESM